MPNKVDAEDITDGQRIKQKQNCKDQTIAERQWTDEKFTNSAENRPIGCHNKEVKTESKECIIGDENKSTENGQEISQQQMNSESGDNVAGDERIVPENKQQINRQQIIKQQMNEQEIAKQEINKQEIDKQENNKQQINKQMIKQQMIIEKNQIKNNEDETVSNENRIAIERDWERIDAINDEMDSFECHTVIKNEQTVKKIDRTAVEMVQVTTEVDRTALEINQMATETDRTALKIDRIARERDRMGTEKDRTVTEIDQNFPDIDQIDRTAIEADQRWIEIDRTAKEKDGTLPEVDIENFLVTLGDSTPRKLDSCDEPVKSEEDVRYPLTRAVKQWMTRTRESTPEVEILKSPNTIYREFVESESDDDEIVDRLYKRTVSEDNHENFGGSERIGRSRQGRSRRFHDDDDEEEANGLEHKKYRERKCDGNKCDERKCRGGKCKHRKCQRSRAGANEQTEEKCDGPKLNVNDEEVTIYPRTSREASLEMDLLDCWATSFVQPNIQDMNLLTESSFSEFSNYRHTNKLFNHQSIQDNEQTVLNEHSGNKRLNEQTVNVTLEETKRQEFSAKQESVENGEDVLEVYESKYGKNEDFLKLKAEVDERMRNGTLPKHGDLPYRAICCSLM